jgi:hypothetical protein
MAVTVEAVRTRDQSGLAACPSTLRPKKIVEGAGGNYTNPPEILYKRDPSDPLSVSSPNTLRLAR